MTLRFAPAARVPPDEAKSQVRAALVELFTLRQSRVPLSLMAKIPATAISHKRAMVGFSQDKGVQLWYPEEAVRSKLLRGVQKLARKIKPAADVSPLPSELPNERYKGEEESAQAIKHEAQEDAQEVVQEVMQEEAQEVMQEEAQEEATEGVQAEAREDQAELLEERNGQEEAWESLQAEPVEGEDSAFQEDAWLRTPLEPLGIKFAVRVPQSLDSSPH